MVYDNEDGLIGIFDSYEKALHEYNLCKEVQKEYVQRNNEFTTDEIIVIAKVERQFYGYETNEKVVDYDENGEEFETVDNSWDWKEDTNELNHNELSRLVARNLVAWDTSKDKREGLLPEVYLLNKYWYKKLIGEEYYQHKAAKKFYIE